MLKAVLIEKNIPYKPVHNIDYLLEKVVESGFVFDGYDRLDSIANTVTHWEEHGRYGLGLKTMTQTVQNVHNIYKNIKTKFVEEFKDSQWLIKYHEALYNRNKTVEECIAEIIESVHNGKSLKNALYALELNEHNKESIMNDKKFKYFLAYMYSAENEDYDTFDFTEINISERIFGISKDNIEEQNRRNDDKEDRKSGEKQSSASIKDRKALAIEAFKYMAHGR